MKSPWYPLIIFNPRNWRKRNEGVPPKSSLFMGEIGEKKYQFGILGIIMTLPR